MKKTASVFLTALLTCCLSAVPMVSADTIPYDQEGLSIDLEAAMDNIEGYTEILDYGTVSRDPYVSLLMVEYCTVPKEEVAKLEGSSSEEASEEVLAAFQNLVTPIALVMVTQTDPQSAIEAAGLNISDPENITEFGKNGDYSFYYYATAPDEELEDAYEEMSEKYPDFFAAEDKEDWMDDAEEAKKDMLEYLKQAELREPVDTNAELVGQVLDFETTDLDGNAVSVKDLFKDNKITMVNFWGTWCGACLSEMGEMEQIYKNAQEKGCGMIGVEYEQKPIEDVKQDALNILSENGITYPNVLFPADDMALLMSIQGFPTTMYVDSEGTIIAPPLIGAQVTQYEAELDRLLEKQASSSDEVPADKADGTESANTAVGGTESTGTESTVGTSSAESAAAAADSTADSTESAAKANSTAASTESTAAADSTTAGSKEAGSVANSVKAYRVYVTDGTAPVEGAVIQFCNDDACMLETTNADGLASFNQPEGEYEIHVLAAPDGFEADDTVYETLNTYCDTTIQLKKK